MGGCFKTFIRRATNSPEPESSLLSFEMHIFKVYLGKRLGSWLVPSQKRNSELREAGDYLGLGRPGQEDDDCSAELSPRLPEGSPNNALQQY